MMLVLATLAVVLALIFSPNVGLVAYLRLASDSIMDELKEQRPQITIRVKPKKRVVKPPATNLQNQENVTEIASRQETDKTKNNQNISFFPSYWWII